MTAFDYLGSTEQQRLDDLKTFLAFPSVSAKSEHAGDVAECARWLADYLRRIGFQVQVYQTKKHPIVYAEYISGPKAPTVFYYGHYDVQPPEPLALWTTPPFKAEVRDGYIYARGAADDKGQTFAHIKGLEALLRTGSALPINVKFLIEGEEEIGSLNLVQFLTEHKEKLDADVAVVSDTAQFNKDLPAITYGLRGLAAFEITVYGPSRDVHSGTFGGAIPNPVTVLCQMVAQLHDKKGKVAVPGFYKDVKTLSKFEKTQYKRLPFNAAKYKKSLGVIGLQGESGFSVFEQTWDRPTCELNGITGGYQGEGSKTIIPSKASCKITCRLVPNQKPKDIAAKFQKYIKQIAPKSVKVEVEFRTGSPGVVVPTDGPWLEAASRAIKTGFGKTPVFMKEGGSIPVVGDFKRILGIDTLLIGFSQSDDNIHSPDERFRVVDFERGCRTAAALPVELAKVSVK